MAVVNQEMVVGPNYPFGGLVVEEGYPGSVKRFLQGGDEAPAFLAAEELARGLFLGVQPLGPEPVQEIFGPVAAQGPPDRKGDWRKDSWRWRD